jgi:hypothetical protein
MVQGEAVRGVPSIRDWDAMVASRVPAPPAAPWPVPSVPQRPAGDSDLPTGARSLLRAVRAPWRARATYARGYPMDRYGRPRATEVDSVVIRLSGPDGARVWAAWVGGKFTAAWLAKSGTLVKLGARDVSALVRGPDDAG